MNLKLKKKTAVITTFCNYHSSSYASYLQINVSDLFIFRWQQELPEFTTVW